MRDEVHVDAGKEVLETNVLGVVEVGMGPAAAEGDVISVTYCRITNFGPGADGIEA
jgi:hypothetical protein